LLWDTLGADDCEFTVYSYRQGGNCCERIKKKIDASRMTKK
jgi:hypothetical protein